MKLYKVEAVVLGAGKVREADRLLVLYSRELGKIKALAYGVDKPSSKKRGSVQPFCHTDFLLRKGRELDVVEQCQALNMYAPLRRSLEGLGYAGYLARLVEAFTPWGEPNADIMDLLLAALELLGNGGDSFMLARYMETRLMDFAGYRPELGQCVVCGDIPRQTRVTVSPAAGGLVCADCSAGEGQLLEVNRGSLEILRLFLRTTPDRLSVLRTDKDARLEIKKLLRQLVEQQLEQKVKSRDFLDWLEGL